jgi:hypothetical protein
MAGMLIHKENVKNVEKTQPVTVHHVLIQITKTLVVNVYYVQQTVSIAIQLDVSAVTSVIYSSHLMTFVRPVLKIALTVTNASNVFNV